MAIQTGPQEICHEVGGGSKKNCGSWAQWEPGSSGGGAMCNGGWSGGFWYEPCPVRTECKVATDKKHLPVYTERRGGTAVLASSPASRRFTEAPAPQREAPLDPAAEFRKNHEAYLSRLQATAPQAGGLRRITPQQSQPQPPGQQYMSHQGNGLPYPIQPPPTFPQQMQTPYAAPLPTTGSQTPTWLPQQEENPFGRLGKNVAQGMLGSFGWHVFDFVRNVDLFSRR